MVLFYGLCGLVVCAMREGRRNAVIARMSRMVVWQVIVRRQVEIGFCDEDIAIGMKDAVMENIEKGNEH